MEVHHHGHIHHQKKWKEYLFQFLMLFLAVFCGFLAEYQLEHTIEKNRERQYIQSFYEDLSADEADLTYIIGQLRDHARKADSLQVLLMQAEPTKPANKIYMYLREIARGAQSYLYLNDRTMVQLRNAGGMRLIQNKNVSDSMMSYYRTFEIIQYLSDDVLVSKRNLREKCTPLLNATDFFKIIDSTTRIINPSENLYLRSLDADVLHECAIWTDRIGSVNKTLAIRMQRLKEKAGRTKTFIRKAYALEE